MDTTGIEIMKGGVYKPPNWAGNQYGPGGFDRVFRAGGRGKGWGD